MTRAMVLVCACALLADAAAKPAPAPPAPRRSENNGSKMAQEKTIVIRRIPNAYFYPFSLWPLPKYPAKDVTESQETYSYYHRRSLQTVQVQQNKR